jgi:myo-inositol 2-dehydrogenase / D-chiro-inositol 1-dehydrogenase
MTASFSKSTDNRRSFLQKSAAAGTVLSAALTSRMVHAQGSGAIKVGLVGCGGRGSGAAVNAMQADSDVQITALADLYDDAIKRCRRSLGRQFERQMKVADEHCFVGLDGFKQLLETDIDVVLLASPPYYRPDHIEAAVAAGKQIFCEKPIATDVVGVKRVEASCREADEKGLNVVSGLCWRYDTNMIDMVKRVHDGAIGEVHTIQSNYLTGPVWMKTREPGESEMQYQMRNWYNYIWLSGDHYVEQFIHSIDKALWINRDQLPIRAVGTGGRQLRDAQSQGNIYDHFAVVYEWENGSRCFAQTRQMDNCYTEVEDYVYGSEGRAKLIEGEIVGKNPYKVSAEAIQMHQAEQNEFFKAVRGNRDRINNGDYMCKSTLMSILGREACYTGKVLTLDELVASELNFSPANYGDDSAPPVTIPQPGSYKLKKVEG